MSPATALLLLAGAALIALAVTDAVVTTLAAGNGGGPLTRRLAALTWRVLRAVGSRVGAGPLRWSGTVVLMVTVLTWVALLWAGCSLVFSSTDQAVVDSTTAAPASIAARVYYAGFVVFTLGVGDYVAGGGAWQIVTAAASFLGLFVVTLSITYLVSVVSAAVSRRALARSVHLSGDTGVDIVRLHWTGDGVSSQLDSLAQDLTTQVLQLTQQHLAYPVLHHFHAAAEASSAPRAMAALDDAVLLLSHGLAPSVRPSSDTLARLRRALEHYAGTPQRGEPAAPDPPLPQLAELRAAGIETVSDREFTAAAPEHARRRRQLHQLVRADARPWPGC